jgi:hypothetical protein
MTEYIITCDIARKRDYFAIMVIRDNAQIVDGSETLGTADKVIHYYEIKLIEQYQGLGYEEMADRVLDIMGNTALKFNADLVVDGTGVGDAAVEMMRKRGLNPVPIIFSGGDAPREHYTDFGTVFGGGFGAKVLKDISVPKKDLVAAGTVMIQQGRLRIAPGRWNEELRKQLAAFKGKVNEKTGNRRYEAETEADHDDLVVCFLMGAWWIFHRRDRDDIPERRLEGNDDAGFEPADYM